MKKLLAIALVTLAAASPAFAALKVGDTAPDFSAQGSIGGKDASFHLRDALRHGPVVVYFYPSAYTGGCDLEAHTFADEADKFKTAGATIVGVSADDLGRLKQFSADPKFCAGKFAIMSDADTKIAQSYALNVTPPREGAKDVNQTDINHAFIERVTYVIGRDGKILATLSSKEDKLSPDQHVDKSLEIVTAAK
jgi:thioredoxin-dependent peroxiredoxin